MKLFAVIKRVGGSFENQVLHIHKASTYSCS
jgi:hypothetical protein